MARKYAKLEKNFDEEFKRQKRLRGNLPFLDEKQTMKSSSADKLRVMVESKTSPIAQHRIVKSMDDASLAKIRKEHAGSLAASYAEFEQAERAKKKKKGK